MSKLRDYQKKLNRPAEKFVLSTRGKIAQIYAPTGAGKTVCFTELLKKAITEGKRNIAIVHPRIALSQDQLRRLKGDFGDSVRFTSFHSGAHVKGKEKIREVNTTNPIELVTIINQTINELDKAHITFSSYNSFEKLLDIEFDILICDEAQYLVQFGFVEKISAKKTLLYTATPITDEMEGGMLDYSVYGKVIAQIEPKVLIERGYIVAPLIHQMECKTNQKSDDVDVIDLVARSFVDQWREITSWGTGMHFHQMLIACRNVEVDIREIENNLITLWTKINQLSLGNISGQIDVYTITASGAFLNGKPLKSRDYALLKIKQSNNHAIVAHYDTLAEGIDIDTLTGAVIMRKMSKAKLIQTIGRCARPYISDLNPITKEPRKDLYNPKKGIDKRTKPRCIITLPVIDGKWIANDDGTMIAKAFIAGGYGDLITYMSSANQQPKGREVTTFELDDDGTIMSAVINSTVKRELEDLRKLFKFGD